MMTMIKTLAALAFLFSSIPGVMAQSAPPDVVTALAPGGKLRVAINFGNTVLAQKDPATGEPRGISVDLARELAKRLGVPIEVTTFDAAGKMTDAFKSGALDIVFLAIDPVRGADIDFTGPYVLIESVYVVPEASPLKTNEDVDRAGVRIAVARGSAYDLYLTRAIKNATLVRESSGPQALDMFVRDKLEAAAGVKQPIIAFANSRSDMRVILGRFMAVEQAIGTPKGRDVGARYLRVFVEELKASGFVADGLKRSGQTDAVVAPPTPGK
jgi:polar amino acid transport system substrate-binding protein